MTLYGISAVKIDERCGEVAAVKLHGITPGLPNSGTVTVDEGRVVDYRDVAKLIVAGDEIRVLVSDGPESLKPTADHVRKKPTGQFEYIESCDADRKSTQALLELPPFNS